MDERIGIERFSGELAKVAMKYPGAKVMSIGTGCNGFSWHYSIYLKWRGDEVKITIPVYVEDCK